ncbi:MAG TPA: hypothetical protein VNW92_09435 [Polyangiaceae bacterium]|nr:hypothetical protein [Polyangiaceae bacterium]
MSGCRLRGVERGREALPGLGDSRELGLWGARVVARDVAGARNTKEIPDDMPG